MNREGSVIERTSSCIAPITVSLATSRLILGVRGKTEGDGYTSAAEEGEHLTFTNCTMRHNSITLSSISHLPHPSLLFFSFFPSPSPLPSSQDYEAKMEELEAALVKQLQTDTAVEKLEEQRKMFMSKLEELETTLSQKHHEVRQPAVVQQADECLASSQLLILMSKCLPLFTVLQFYCQKNMKEQL